MTSPPEVPHRAARRWGTVVCAAAALAFAAACPGRGAEAPNVLVIVMDTTRADRCSLHGHEPKTTSRLDEFAAGAVVFDDAWSPASWTFPAHASLFTGRMPEAVGSLAPYLRPIDAKIPTLAETLAGAGWATACFTNNAWIAPQSGLTRGFGTVKAYYTAPSARAAHDAALVWMRERKAKGERFFGFVNDVEPHAPWTPPEEVQRRFVPAGVPAATVQAARRIEAPRTVAISIGKVSVDPAVLDVIPHLYDAEIATLDEEVGRLLDTMRAEGLLDRTLVVVTSDHGEGLGDHGWLEHGAFLHRELLRVPLLVRYPDGAGAGTRVADVVRLQDVFPTVLEACGVRVPAGLDALSLRAPLAGRLARAVERPLDVWIDAVAENSTREVADRLGQRRRSVYDGRHHLIVDASGGVELYDVSADPAERTNLAPSDPETVRRLTELLPK